MPQLQAAGAGLEQERREHEEVLAAHERDLDIRAPPQHPLEVSHGGDAAESAAEYDDAHVPSRMAWSPRRANIGLGEERFPFFDDIGGQLRAFPVADVLRRVNRAGRDEENVARLQRDRRFSFHLGTPAAPLRERR